MWFTMFKENKYLWALIFITFFFKAQPPKSFLTSFGTNGLDVAYDVKEGHEKSYWIVGQTSGFGFGSTDAYVVNMDSMGQILFHKSFGGFLGDCANAVEFNPADSGCFVAGYTQSFGNGGYDIYFFRLDKNGNLLWQNYFGGTDWEFASDILLGQDNQIYIVGKTYSFGNGSSDAVILKVNPVNGAIVSSKTLGGLYEDEFKSVINLSDGNLLTCGTTKSYGEPNGDIWVVKWNTSLDTLITKRYGTPFKDLGNDVMEHPNGQIWLAAFSATSATHKGDNYILYLTSGFNVIGETRHNLYYDQSEGYLKVIHNKSNKDRTLFLTWYFDTQYNFYKLQGYFYIGGVNNVYLIANAFGGNGFDYVYGVDATTDGGFIIVGQSNSGNAVNGDVLVLKVDTTYVNYPSMVGLKENFNVDKTGLIYVYRNELYIKDVTDDIQNLSVTDITGRKVLALYYPKTNEGIPLNLMNGVYFAELSTSNNKRYTQKIIIHD